MFFSALYKLSQLGSFMCWDSTCSMLLSLLKARLATEQCQSRVPAVGLPLWCSGSYMASLAASCPVGNFVSWNSIPFFFSAPYPHGAVAFCLHKNLIHCRSKLNLVIDPESGIIAIIIARSVSILVTSEVSRRLLRFLGT